MVKIISTSQNCNDAKKAKALRSDLRRYIEPDDPLLLGFLKQKSLLLQKDINKNILLFLVIKKIRFWLFLSFLKGHIVHKLGGFVSPNLQDVIRFKRSRCLGNANLLTSVFRKLGFSEDEVHTLIISNNGSKTFHAVVLIKIEEDTFVIETSYPRIFEYKKYAKIDKVKHLVIFNDKNIRYPHSEITLKSSFF